MEGRGEGSYRGTMAEGHSGILATWESGPLVPLNIFFLFLMIEVKVGGRGHQMTSKSPPLSGHEKEKTFPK